MPDTRSDRMFLGGGGALGTCASGDSRDWLPRLGRENDIHQSWGGSGTMPRGDEEASGDVAAEAVLVGESGKARGETPPAASQCVRPPREGGGAATVALAAGF
mmetsp:Transcript_66972/g.153668  ORF Transcript_66972/g.153668 Transcript_66972/m.153668 type:complete len:103 (-) Transcript_66972:214-522(-)